MQKYFSFISQTPLKNSKKSPVPDTFGPSNTTPNQKGEASSQARKLKNPDNLFSTPRDTCDGFEQKDIFR